MSVQIPVELSEDEDAFVQRLVDDGTYPDADAVFQAGLESLKDSLRQAGALRELLDARRADATIDPEEGRQRTEAMIARKKDESGL